MIKRIDYDDGRIEYRNENDLRHRDDGPAIILSSGTKIWCKNDEYHREDGPAVIWSYGEVDWWLNDNHYSFKEWCELINISDEEKMELALKYG